MQEAFPNIVPVPRLLVDNQDIKDPNWLSGFTCAEGCFLIKLKKKSTSGYYVNLRFQITQNIKDEQLMKSLITYLECGRYEINKDKRWEDKRKEVGNFVCTKFSDIDEKIIPFFNKHPLFGEKYINYVDWCKAAKIIKAKTHLTKGGLEEIIKIKGGMNKKRIYPNFKI